MKILRVSSKALREIDALLDSGKKIHAIKLLRNETGSGLKEAKLALDKRQGHSPHGDAADIGPIVSVKSITVDMGEGEVILSLDELNMMTLVGMQKLGIDETRRVLDLHDMIMNWEKGICLSPEES